MLVFIVRTGIRLVIGFLCILIYMNLLGKMQLAPRSAMDQIGNYVVGGIIGGIIYNMELPLWKFFISILIWGALMLLMNQIKIKNLKAKRIIEGNPILLMEDGHINFDGFTEAKMSADDLMSRIHQMGIASLTEVRSVWLETNGQLTVVKKDDDNLALALIEDGQINHLDLRKSYRTQEWILDELKKKNIDDISKVFYAEVLHGKFIVYLYDGRILN